ncbi:MAG: NHL repeat-containing protein [Geitlerinemataceae cyanobacterium]
MKPTQIFTVSASIILGSVASFCWNASPARAVLLVGNTTSSDLGGSNVLKFDEFTGEFLGEFIATGSGGLSSPDDLTFGPDGNLYISSGNDSATPETEPSAILRFDGKTGTFLDVFAKSDRLNRPYGNAFGPDGNFYVASFLSDEILRFDGKTGDFLDVFASGNQLPGGLNGPNDLLFTPDGKLLVTTQGSVAVNGAADFSFGLPSQILKFDLATGTSSIFADQPQPSPDSFGFVSFLGLAISPDGKLFASDFANGIRTYDLGTGELLDFISTNYTGTSPSNNFIGSLAFTPNGNLFTVGFDFTQENVGTILRYDGITGMPLPAPGKSSAIFVDANPNLVRPIGIAFQPTKAVPEPTSVLEPIAVGAVAVFLLRHRKRKRHN